MSLDSPHLCWTSESESCSCSEWRVVSPRSLRCSLEKDDDVWNPQQNTGWLSSSSIFSLFLIAPLGRNFKRSFFMYLAARGHADKLSSLEENKKEKKNDRTILMTIKTPYFIWGDFCVYEEWQACSGNNSLDSVSLTTDNLGSAQRKPLCAFSSPLSRQQFLRPCTSKNPSFPLTFYHGQSKSPIAKQSLVRSLIRKWTMMKFSLLSPLQLLCLKIL